MVVPQVSDFINCGVYIFTPEIFNAIKDVTSSKHEICELLGFLVDIEVEPVHVLCLSA